MVRCAWSGSDVGRVRAVNEDALCSLDTEGVYAVADGVGGRQGGAVASSIAVETLSVAASLLRDLARRCEASPKVVVVRPK